MINVEKIKPSGIFTNYIYKTIPLAFDESMSYYETLCGLLSLLKDTIEPTINNNADALIELQDYVTHYFDNLDVQEEINNKLDEMVEDGTLEEIISEYITIDVQRTYNNNDELINDSSLTNGMNVKTLGKINSNDGGGCYYKITETEPSSLPIENNNEETDNFYLTLDNGLYAVPVNNINSDYYDEISCVKERNNDTDCYFTTIPYKDNNNNEINLYIKNNSGMEISDYARLHKTTVSINATLGVDNPDTGTNDNASVISDGEIIRDFMNPPTFLDDHYKFIGIKADREIVDFQANETTAEQMVTAGVKQGWLCFGKLVDNGAITSYAQNPDDEIMNNYYPRQALGVKPDKTIIILTCDGRTVQDKGLKGTELAQLLIQKGCINAWNLDGGGSTNTVFKGTRVNKFIDGEGTSERHIVYCLNVKKPTTNKNIDDINSFIGKIKDDIIKQYLPTIPRMIMKNGYDLNTLKTGTNMYSIFNATNYPSDGNNYGYLVVIPIASTNNELFGLYCKQIYLSRTDNRIWTRTLVNNVWTEWQLITSMLSGEVECTSNQSMGIGANYEVVQLSGTISDYMPNYLSIDNNKIVTSKACGVLVNAVFTITCGLDGTMTIRLRKNGTGAIQVIQFTGVAGQTYNVSIQKMLSLNANDYIDFTSNGGTNTDGVNKIFLGNINIIQNI